jgi:hypothetical protein
MRNDISLGEMIKQNIAKNHRKNIDPTEEEVLGKPVRGSDVPLFWGKGKESLGVEIKNAYNYIMNIFAYTPRGTWSHPLQKTTYKQETIDLLVDLKKEKKSYSDVWKANFSKYQHTGVGATINYDETDPFDDSWMKHELLEHSMEMQAAAAAYLQKAEEILDKLLKIQEKMIFELQGACIALSITMEEWVEEGKKLVEEQLVYFQGIVDKILVQEWIEVKPFLGQLHKDIFPTYIGSTNTGQKSITKAYIQFNPEDFDVDGQLKAPMLYMALDDLGMKASKGRFFVRKLIKDDVIGKINAELVAYPNAVIDDEVESQGEINTNGQYEGDRLRELEQLLLALDNYVRRVEIRLVDEVEGIEKDYDDEFDLAIVMD